VLRESVNCRRQWAGEWIVLAAEHCEGEVAGYKGKRTECRILSRKLYGKCKHRLDWRYY
jgi:hypothetical protein